MQLGQNQLIFFVHSDNYYDSVKKVPQKLPLDTRNTVLATHAWRIWQGIVNENCFARKFLGKVECSSDKTSWIFSLRVSFIMILRKKIPQKVPLDTRNTILATHAWRIWQGLEKNQIDDFKNCFAQKFPGKIESSFDKISWIFLLTVPINMILWKKFRKKRLWTRGIQFRQPMLEESGKDYQKNQIDDFENCFAQKFPGKVECRSDKTSWIFSLTVPTNMILWIKFRKNFLWTRRIQVWQPMLEECGKE